MLRPDIFLQRFDPPELGLPSDSHPEPGVIQICGKVQQVRPLGQEQKLMLRVGGDPGKYFLPPFRFPACQIAHTRQQVIVRARLIHQPQLFRIKLRVGKIVDHMPALYIVPGVAVRTAHRAADDKIHGFS